MAAGFKSEVSKSPSSMSNLGILTLLSSSDRAFWPLSGTERTEFTNAKRKFSRESLFDWIGGGVEIRNNIDGVRRVPLESLLDRDLIVTVSGSKGGIGPDSWFSPEDMVDKDGTLLGIERTEFTKAERKFSRESL